MGKKPDAAEDAIVGNAEVVALAAGPSHSEGTIATPVTSNEPIDQASVTNSGDAQQTESFSLTPFIIPAFTLSTS